MNWTDALRYVCRQYINQPLEYGTRDCCRFAAAYVEARTGIDHSAAFSYDSEFSALKILAQHDGIQNLIASCIGAPKQGAPTEGDLVVCDLQIDAERAVVTTGVNNGAYVWGIHPDSGLCRIPLKAIAAAWSV
jgi:hypothetical protein